MIEELKNSIKNRNVILFVGAGVSATLGLPDWNSLINHIAKELDYDEQIFNQYGDSLLLAEYYKLSKSHIGELRSWMDCNWNVDETLIMKSKIYEAIIKLNFSKIYTTNYDHCLEKAFSAWNVKYHRIVNLEDFISQDDSITQIIKFHGDTISDSSIVLTESDYFERLNFYSPLDIKLQFDMLGKSILFIGYSLSDINIRLLIYKISKLWNKYNTSKRPKMYLFLPNPNPIQELILQSRGVYTIIGNNHDKTKSMENFLQNLVE